MQICFEFDTKQFLSRKLKIIRMTFIRSVQLGNPALESILWNFFSSETQNFSVFLLLSLSVCNIWKNVFTMKWPSLTAKIGKRRKTKFDRIGSWCQFHQHVYAQFLRSKIPKVQKRLSCQAAFCAFKIFVHKSCV